MSNTKYLWTNPPTVTGSYHHREDEYMTLIIASKLTSLILVVLIILIAATVAPEKIATGMTDEAIKATTRWDVMGPVLAMSTGWLILAGTIRPRNMDAEGILQILIEIGAAATTGVAGWIWLRNVLGTEALGYTLLIGLTAFIMTVALAAGAFAGHLSDQNTGSN